MIMGASHRRRPPLAHQYDQLGADEQAVRVLVDGVLGGADAKRNVLDECGALEAKNGAHLGEMLPRAWRPARRVHP